MSVYLRPILNIPILAEFLAGLWISFADNVGAERGELFYAASLGLSDVTGTLPKPERSLYIAAVCVQL